MFAKFFIFAIIAIFVKIATFQWAPLDSFEFSQNLWRILPFLLLCTFLDIPGQGSGAYSGKGTGTYCDKMKYISENMTGQFCISPDAS